MESSTPSSLGQKHHLKSFLYYTFLIAGSCFLKLYFEGSINKLPASDNISFSLKESEQLEPKHDIYNNSNKAFNSSGVSLRFSSEATLQNKSMFEKISINPSVLPLWKCHSPRPTSSNLIFIHVFKAAGSTVSSFFKSYSEKCHTSYARVISCTNVIPESLQNETNWKKCTLKYGVDRNGLYYETNKKGKMNMTFMENTDIVGGHMKLGTVSTGVNRRLKYISFFRNAAAKYVSAVIYVKGKKKGTTMKTIVDTIKTRVNREFKHGKYYLKYDSYLVTPFQKRHFQKMSIEKKVDLIKRNLVEYNVTIGIVERMSESLEILQHILDGDKVAGDVFVDYGMKDKNGVIKEHKANRSPISASTMLNILKKDEQFYEKFIEYLKYEQEITDFAHQLHVEQYQTIKNIIL